MRIRLSELAVNAKIFEEWENETGKKFIVANFYTIYDSPEQWVEYIQRTKRKKLKRILDGKIIKARELENKIWELVIVEGEKKKHTFYIGALNSFWTVFTERKNSFNRIFRNLIKYSTGINHAWISPLQMKEIIEKYAKIGTLQAISKSPSFAIPKRAPIPAKDRAEIPESFFKRISATVQFWAPREIFYLNDALTYKELKISRDYLYRISKLIFRTKFDNPGKSKISVENDAIMSHEEGVPKATEIVFDDIFETSFTWIKKVNNCLPEFEIRRDPSGEILNLHYKKKPKEMYFWIQEKKFSFEHLIKLEQILISGSSETELVGYRLSASENSISLRSFYPRFNQDALIDLELESNRINVRVFPYSTTGPHILLQIYRVINEKFAWYISQIEVRDRYENKN